MKVVLDTNCLYQSLYRQGDYFIVWDSFRKGKYTLCVTTEILEEYQEIIARFTNVDIAQTMIDVILNAQNTEFVTVFYHWNLITKDKDDNKFSDCAIACGASYVVSDDKHFKELDLVDFPQITHIKLKDFREILR